LGLYSAAALVPNPEHLLPGQAGHQRRCGRRGQGEDQALVDRRLDLLSQSCDLGPPLVEFVLQLGGPLLLRPEEVVEPAVQPCEFFAKVLAPGGERGEFPVELVNLFLELLLSGAEFAQLRALAVPSVVVLTVLSAPLLARLLAPVEQRAPQSGLDPALRPVLR